MSYVSNRNLSNVVGRIDYISNEDRQENIVDFYNSQDLDFWKKLAKENREQFKVYAKKGNKAVEAREFIIALPQDINTNSLAKKLCDDFYQKYGVYCACAIHYKSKNDNLHAHLIFSERELLPEPKVVETRVTPRTYYYNAEGKKCKKAEAVKIVPKGTVLQKGCTRYFENKKDFFSMSFVNNYKNHIENELNLPKFDTSRHFPTKHIGKNNAKGEFVSEYNELINELNHYFDQVEGIYDFDGKTPKQKFCELTGENRLYVPQIDKIRNFFNDFEILYPLNEKTAQIENENLTEIEPQKLIDEYREIQEDINYCFEVYDCPYRQLKRYALWEQEGKESWIYEKDFFTKEYGFQKAETQINDLIDKYNMSQYEGIPRISNNSTRSEAYNIAKAVLEALKGLLEQIKEWFAKITGKEIEPIIEDIEREEEYEIEIDDEW